MNYVFVDLEMTCYDTRIKTDKEGKIFVHDGSGKLFLQTKKTEIIEIGAAKLNDNMELIDTFQRFVKPINSTLSRKCRKFTSITQEDINASDEFAKSMDEFINWIGEDEFVFCAWSKDDKLQIVREAEQKSYDKTKVQEIFKNYYVLQDDFTRAYNAIKNIPSADSYSLKTSLDIMKIEYEKPLHRAINDAIATSQLYVKFLNIDKEIPRENVGTTINDVIDPFIKKRLEAVFNLQLS